MIDRGFVLSIAGIDLVSEEARIVVASIDTYLNYANAVSYLEPMSARR